MRPSIYARIRGYYYWWFVFSREDRQEWREADRRWAERHTV